MYAPVQAVHGLEQRQRGDHQYLLKEVMMIVIMTNINTNINNGSVNDNASDINNDRDSDNLNQEKPIAKLRACPPTGPPIYLPGLKDRKEEDNTLGDEVIYIDVEEKNVYSTDNKSDHNVNVNIFIVKDHVIPAVNEEGYDYFNIDEEEDIYTKDGYDIINLT